jgi:hypothetical protein
MDSEELRTALRTATAELTPRLNLTQDVLRGGARRKRRRRIAVVAIAAVVTVGAVATSIVGWQAMSVQEARDPRLGEPTHGDLAQDTVFTTKAVDLWENAVAGAMTYTFKLSDRVADRPHVYWAGTTPNGPAAVILQAMNPVEDKVGATILGIVGNDAQGQASVLITEDPAGRTLGNPGFRIGPAEHTVLVLDPGGPLFLSGKVSYDDKGKAVRDWQPMVKRDGVAVAELPAGTTGVDARVLHADPARGVNYNDAIDLMGVSESPGSDRAQRLGWGDTNDMLGPPFLMWAGSETPHWNDPDWTKGHFNDELRGSGLLDPTDPGLMPMNWYVSAPDGSGGTTIVGEYVPLLSGQSRLYAVILDRDDHPVDVLSLGPIDHKATLPVVAHLPGQNRIVAAKGATLSYRTGPGAEWLGKKPDAIAIPANAKQVQVQPPGADPVIVDVA